MRIGGLVMSGLMRIPDHGIRRQKDQVPLRDVVTDVMQEVQLQHLACVSIYRAGASGSARAPVLLACIAGSGLGAGTGVSPPAIKAFGGEFPGGKEGYSPHKDSRCIGGNLRNGSNAGSAYLNCRNRLGNENWNYAA